ncbi:hypothetical protein JCM33374_g6621 [Metschnikowia sp. JCM 33374]|nr:hypothetical protein JCM33374_g6621 [Metschnikowia sp. JCM 33374]
MIAHLDNDDILHDVLSIMGLPVLPEPPNVLDPDQENFMRLPPTNEPQFLDDEAMNSQNDIPIQAYSEFNHNVGSWEHTGCETKAETHMDGLDSNDQPKITTSTSSLQYMDSEGVDHLSPMVSTSILEENTPDSLDSEPIIDLLSLYEAFIPGAFYREPSMNEISDISTSPHLPKKCSQTTYPNTDSAQALSSLVETNIDGWGFNPAAKNQTLVDAQETFSTIFPLLQSAHINSSEAFLAKALTPYHSQVPLAGLYNLLYNYPSPESIPSLIMQTNCGGEPMPLNTAKEALKFCHLILETFKHPNTIKDEILNPALTHVNFHEVSRSLLAIKILAGCIHQVDASYMTVSRASIFKAYYIICQHLIYKYPTESNSWADQQNVILGQSKLGKLMKLVFPNMQSKRLGRRGHSKSQLIGFIWNKSMVSDDILCLLKLEMPELRQLFESPIVANDTKSKSKDLASLRHASKRVVPGPTPQAGISRLSAKPLYSYVDSLSTYPGWSFSPRDWTEECNNVPRHSTWAKHTMDRSVEVLKRHRVDVSTLIKNFEVCVFTCNVGDSLSGTITQAMKILRDSSSPNEVFLHLYLAIILLIFPVILASDQEVSRESKTVLRFALIECVDTLEADSENGDSADQISLRNFTQILRRLKYLNEMTSSTIKPTYSQSVLNEMTNDMRSQMDIARTPGQLSEMESKIIRGLIMSINAYSFRLAEDGPNYQQDSVHIVSKITKIISEEILVSAKSIESSSQQAHLDMDVPYQVFKIYVKSFHKIMMQYHDIAQLPIAVISSIIHHYTHQMQNSRFQKFGKHTIHTCVQKPSSLGGFVPQCSRNIYR